MEMYKVKHGLCPTSISDLFPLKNNRYNLRKDHEFILPRIKSVKNGKETLAYRGPFTWALVPNEIKNAESFPEFKRKIKTWEPKGCCCRLCRKYVHNLGFI